MGLVEQDRRGRRPRLGRTHDPAHGARKGAMIFGPKAQLVVARGVGHDLAALEQGREGRDAVDWRGAEGDLLE